MKWENAHNRIVSEKSRKQIINSVILTTSVFTPLIARKEIRRTANNGSFALVVGLKSLFFFFSFLIVFSKYSLMSMQYIYYQKKVIHLTPVIKVHGLFGLCPALIYKVAGV